MKEIEYTPIVTNAVVKFDDDKFRMAAKEYMANDDCPKPSDYSCFDDWAFDITLELNHDDFCMLPWNKDIYINLFELDTYIRFSDELINKVYVVCKEIIKEIYSEEIG